MNTVPPKKLRLKSLLVTGFLICASGIVSAQTSDVTSAPFGQTSDGKPIELYTLSNPAWNEGGNRHLWRHHC
jgi:hypothetical protein